MQTPSKLALSFVHTKIVQYGQKRMDFRYMIYGLDKIPQDPFHPPLTPSECNCAKTSLGLHPSSKDSKPKVYHLEKAFRENKDGLW